MLDLISHLTVRLYWYICSTQPVVNCFHLHWLCRLRSEFRSFRTLEMKVIGNVPAKSLHHIEIVFFFIKRCKFMGEIRVLVAYLLLMLLDQTAFLWLFLYAEPHLFHSSLGILATVLR